MSVVRARPFYLAAWLLLSLCGIAQAEGPQPVRDLRYGAALFDFYQDKYFSAISDLMVAQAQRPIDAQGAEPELLLGGMYLAYGLHDEASRIFDRLLDQNAEPRIRDQAWFYIGKLRYQNGRYADAEAAFGRVGNTLPPDYEAERLNLLTNVYLAEGKYENAVKTLVAFPDESVWKLYSQFNIGVWLIRGGKLAEGTVLLDAIGTQPATDEERLALRDKANLALGYAYIGAHQLDQAGVYFGRVRLKGPFSNRALLGLGLARNTETHYRESLVPWLELQSRSALDPAVQEALFAIPYTLEKMSQPREALGYYRQTLHIYDAELQRLDTTVAAVKDGDLVNALRPVNLDENTSIAPRLEQPPKSVASVYLTDLIAGTRFQQAYKDYRDLLYLKHVLTHWSQQLPAFSDMLSERRRSYEEKLARLKSDPRLSMLESYRKQRDALAAKLNAIRSHDDAMALVTPAEEALLKRLKSVHEALQHLRGKQDVSDEEARYRIYHGLLEWQISTDFNPRLWQAERSFKELDDALAEAKAADASLQQAWIDAPKSFEGFAARVTAQRGRLAALQRRIDGTVQFAAQRLQSLALTELEKRRQRLEQQRVRARFSMVRLEDSLAAQSAAPHPQPSKDATATPPPAQSSVPAPVKGPVKP